MSARFSVASRARTEVKQGANGPSERLLWCVSCEKRADFQLIRLSFCPCHTSIRYGICAECRDGAESEKRIVELMERSYFEGNRDFPDEAFEKLCDEAVRQYAAGRGRWRT